MLEDKKSSQLIPGRNLLADSFRHEMEAMMSRFFGGASQFSPLETAAQRTGFPSLDMTGAISPAIDINETDAAIELTAELPGLAEKDVEIELKDGHLTLRGQKNVTHDDMAISASAREAMAALPEPCRYQIQLKWRK